MRCFNFRSFIIFLFLLSSFNTIHSQFNRLGGGLAFNSPIASPDLHIGNPGFNFRGIYEINRKFFVIPSITLQVPKKKHFEEGIDKMTFMGNTEVNVTYALAIEKQLLFYALVSPGFSNVYTSWDPETEEFNNKYEFCPSIGIGTGVEMIVEGNVNAFAQVEYMLCKYQQLVISIGVYYYIEKRIRRIW